MDRATTSDTHSQKGEAAVETVNPDDKLEQEPSADADNDTKEEFLEVPTDRATGNDDSILQEETEEKEGDNQKEYGHTKTEGNDEEEEQDDEEGDREEEAADDDKAEERQDQDEQTEVGMSVVLKHAGTDTIPNPAEGQQYSNNGLEEMEPDSYTSSLIALQNSNAAATVRFLLMPSQQVATQRCLLVQTIAELRQQFAAEMKLTKDVIFVVAEGKQIEDSTSLQQLGVVPNGTIQLELHSADPANYPLNLVRPRFEYHMPDVITVRIVGSENLQYRDVVVEIERTTSRKPFLGGYRHKVTGVEYHHAAAQTVPKPRPPSTVQRFCRDTQTAQQRHIRQQTSNATSTQMTKIGAYVSCNEDRLIEPKRYTTADERLDMIISKAIIIQKYYRRWLAKKYVDKVRQNEHQRREWERQEELNKIKEKENRVRREFERRMNPKTKEDFDLLFHALEKWRLEEVARIDATLTGAERKAALCMLLDQETQLLASIGRHKLDANAENRQKFIIEFLEKTSSPKVWKGPDGKDTAMDTPYTMRARQLRDIYNSINMKYVTQDERLDALLTLKHTVKEHDCKLTKEIIELVDREADLLIRGVKESNLDGLRKRISDLFFQYIKTPTFNPEAARFLKVPQDPSVLQNNIYYCTGCSQYLPSTEFQLSSNSKAIGRCRQCSKMNNNAIRRQDFTQYSYMLKNVCRSEEAFNDGSKIAFLMQESDIRYLVEKIWDSQSILSAWNDLYDLVLIRWNCDEEWSPWNCVLLTKDEAAAHVKIGDREQEYGRDFVHRVKHKHTIAKNYFFRLPVMAEHVRAKASGHSASSLTGSNSAAAAVRTVSGTRAVQSSA